MNKSYRIVWNHVRKCLMVVSELTKSKSKAGGASKTSTVLRSVGAAMLAVGAGQALATDYEIPNNPYGYTYPGTLDLATGDTLNVLNTGSVGGATAVGVVANSVTLGTASIAADTYSLINAGTISGSQNGVLASNATFLSPLVNLGRIAAGGNAIAITQTALNSGFNNTGTVVSGGTAIRLLGGSAILGGLVNSGFVDGGAAQAIGVWGASSIDTIDNQTAGTLTGNYGVFVGNGSTLGGIINAGLIQARHDAGVTLRASQLTSGIQNLAGGTIAGTFAGTLGGAGILLFNQSSLAGGIDNAGLILGGDSGIGIASSQVGSGINNRVGGTLHGDLSHGIALLSGSSVTGGITNSGLILGQQKAGVFISRSSLVGGIVNGGNIAGSSTGILVSAATMSGGIYNQAGGTISGGQYGIQVAQNGSAMGSLIQGAITNAGLVSGSVNSVHVDSASSVERIVIAGSDTAHFSGGVFAPNTSVTVAGGALYRLDANYTVASFKNSGSLVLVPSSTFTIAGGNYYQEAAANLVVTVANTTAGQYGSMLVDGVATYGTGSGIDIRLGLASGVTDGATIAGVFSATGGIASSGFKVSDNSVNYDFVATVTGANHQIDVLASTVTGVCTGNLSGSNTGPCLVAYDAPYLSLAANSTITSTLSGVKVLPGAIDGTVGGSFVGVGVTNAGIISAAQYGIHVLSSSHLQGAILNSGTVDGGTVGIRVEPNAVIAGGISNDGSVSGYNSGIGLYRSSLSGGLQNTGTVQGAMYASVYLVSSQINGGVTNAGVIGLGYQSILIENSTITGGISNSGLLNGANAGVNLGGSRLVGGIQNIGTISSGAGNGVFIVGSSIIDGSIVNAGSIYGLYSAMNINGAVINGDIDNSGVLLGSSISGAALGVGYAQVNGNLINSGSVSGHGYGLFVSYSTITGGIQNQASATLASQNTGLFVANAAVANGVTNAGVIEGLSASGIAIVGAQVRGGVSNVSGASISGLNGIRINSTGTVYGGIGNAGFISSINNAGFISASGYGIYLARDSQIAVGITNAGLMQGGSVGLFVDGATVNGAVLNTIGGLIYGGSSGFRFNQSQLNGGLNNAGTIYGHFNAINITQSTIVGALLNQGRIVGPNGVGVQVVQSSLGSISNTGTIVSQNQGIWLTNSTVSGAIRNAGLINSSYVDAGFQVDNSNVNSIANEGTIVGNTVALAINAATIASGVTNSGMMYAYSNAAVSVVGNVVDILNDASGTIVGSINGSLNLRNNGLVALQGMSGVAIVPGSHVSANISGNYYQSSIGGLHIGVDGFGGSGTLAGNYSTLGVGGTATFEIDSAIRVSMSAHDAVHIGGTLAGVVSPAGGLTSNGFVITDNSSLVNFVASTSSGALDLIAIANQSACAATISGPQAGPCEIAIDKQAMNILTAGQISGGGAGINVLSGAITAGGVLNAGTIAGANHGVAFQSATTFTGAVRNSGLIRGDMATGVVLENATIVGQILNTVGGAIIGGDNGIKLARSAITGGISNEGLVQGLSSSGISIVASQLDGGIRNLAGGTIAGVSNYLGIGGYYGGGIDVFASTVTGGVDNAGLITNTSAYSWFYGAGAINLVGASIAGGMNNRATGIITSDNTGINLGGWWYSGPYNGPTQVEGGITNSGLIAGSFSGLTAIWATIGGGIQNDGSIAGSIVGLLAQNSSIAGGLRNAGTIIGGVGALIGSEVAIEGGVNNTGLIEGGSIGGYGAVSLVSSIVAGGIQNSGTIRSTGIAGGSSMAGGAINLFGGQLSGGITNSGLIQSAFGPGVSINQSTVDGGVLNQPGGTMVGATGLQVGQTYFGVSSSGDYYNHYGSTLTGGVVNAGLIQGTTDAGLKIVGSAWSGDVVNNVGATVVGANGGISVSAGLTGYSHPTVIRSIINGAIINTGLISGGLGAGIALSNTDMVGAIANNKGGVVNGATGVKLFNSTITGGITNSGLIAGGVNAIYVDSTSSIDRIVIAGNNTASFGGAVYAPNTPVTVAGGATYTLNSNFEVSNFNNHGTLIAPVASVATPTITGNLTLGNTGTFAPTVASQTRYTQITVSGNASIAGALAVNAAAVTTIAAGSTLAGLITAASVSGVFGSYTDNSVLYDFVPVYGNNSLGLAVVQNSSGNTYTTAAQSTGNLAALGVAGALQQISTMTGVMTPVTTAFGQMTSNQQISNAMSQTLPVMSGATVWNTMSVLTGINRIIEARHLINKGISSGEDFSGNNALWMKPFGTWTDQGNQNGAYGFKANTGGLMMGGDTTVGADTRLGLAFGWGNSYATSNAGVAPQSQTSNLYQFIGYGSYALSETLEANFQANGGWNSNTSNRQIGFMGTSAQGSYNSAVWHVGAGLSNPFHVTETTQFIPSARFDYTWIKNQGYSETGASNGLGLNVNSETYQTSILGADLKGIQKLSDHNSINANIGVGYNFSPTQTWVAASFQGAPGLQFTTNGINPQAVMGRAGVGYTYKVNNGLDLGVRYDLDFQNSYTNQTATAKARWMF